MQLVSARRHHSLRIRSQARLLKGQFGKASDSSCFFFTRREFDLASFFLNKLHFVLLFALPCSICHLSELTGAGQIFDRFGDLPVVFDQDLICRNRAEGGGYEIVANPRFDE